MKLIPMTDFVLETYDKEEDSIDSEYKMFNYAKFLKQNNEIWMFVPCKLVDGVWVVLEEPVIINYTHCKGEKYEWIDQDKFNSDKEIYQQAKELVLFYTFVFTCKIENEIYLDFVAYINNIVLSQDNQLIYDLENDRFTFESDYISEADTIEDLVKLGLELTQTALKQIGI